LALNTDTTGSNEVLMNMLAGELGILDEATGEFLEEYADASWETILNAYLDNLYGTDDSTQKTAAKSALMG